MRITIPTRPVPFARPGRRQDGRRYTPKKYDQWKRYAAATMRTEITRAVGPRFDAELLSGPVMAVVYVHADRVEVELEPAARVRPKGLRGDLDNYTKAVLDAAQEAKWIDDDRQVVEILVRFENNHEEPL